jgi:signal transduction histidine kinase
MTDPNILVSKLVSFETEGRLLQELGERLVSNADVALLELIKNSYDADASACKVTYSGDKITIKDDGHGITENEFLKKWMRIATGQKQKERSSRNYKRLMTGAKGIGRFAVRFLGGKLRLESIAEDTERKCKTKLVSDFDWENIDKSTELNKAKIPYQIIKEDFSAKNGTSLIISQLRDTEKIDFGTALKTQALSIVSPISGLDRGRFNYLKKDSKDPGFQLELPGNVQNNEDINLAETVLSHYYARIIIEYYDSELAYKIIHKDKRILLNWTFNYRSHISQGLQGDIRYFPRRFGMFQGTEVNGLKAWNWIRDNCGIGIIDHGFRVRPFGFEDDDWLHLQIDAAHNKREWRSKIMEKHYPIEEPLKNQSKEKSNPMLYLPNFHQLVGAIFVESNQDINKNRPTDLTPSADREGFLENEAYNELVEIVRTGMELLAFVDHRENRRLEEEKAHLKASALKSDFRQAIKYIKGITSLDADDKNQIIIQYSNLSEKLEKVEDYYDEVKQSMQTMALLGVLAGFITHEAKSLISEIKKILEHLEKIATSDNFIAKILPKIKSTFDEFNGQIDYSTMFIGSIQDKTIKSNRIPVHGQIELIIERFKKFVNDRNIKVINEVDENLKGPSLPIAIYSGILLNLYTNALKAVTMGSSVIENPSITFKAWNEKGRHILEVADNGIGIPEEIKKYVWDPLFTTTSGGIANPLGSGMGLGLSLIKEILSQLKGRINIVEPPPGFNTCFKIEFQLIEE